MKSFLSNLNLARIIILASLAGSAFLGWTGWQAYGELSDLREALEYQAPKVVNDIQQASLRHTELTRGVEGDGLARVGSPQSYIRKCKDHRLVQVGDVDVKERTVENLSAKGIVDSVYTIIPADKKRAFTTSTIASFMYRLEADSRQIKVTDLTIEQVGRRTKPSEIPPDKWTFQAEVTSRQKKE
ncbi:MAG: hypothetical protein QF903_10470 [Planctomycetota bacterium]|nr:hypothetical protein [Planctomycetota bacterium]